MQVVTLNMQYLRVAFAYRDFSHHFYKPKKQETDMDYDRTHQSHLESKYKAQKQNGTFLSFHPLYSMD